MIKEEIQRQGAEKAIKLLHPYEGTSGWSITKQRFFPVQQKIDAKGVYTIGRGHVVKPGEDFSKGLTLKEVDELFIKDLAPRIKAVDKILNGKYTVDQFAAVLSSYYNLPVIWANSPGVEFRKGNIKRSAERLLLYHKDGNLKNSLGLWRRRGSEALLMLTGKVMAAKDPISERLLFLELDKLGLNYLRPKF
jgi:lysozyme